MAAPSGVPVDVSPSNGWLAVVASFVAPMAGLPWATLLAAGVVASVAALLGQLRLIGKPGGLPSWRVFVGSMVSAFPAGIVISAIALGLGAKPEYTLAAVVVVGLLGTTGLDLILDRAITAVGSVKLNSKPLTQPSKSNP